MKKIFTLIIFVLSFATTINAQSEKQIEKSIQLEASTSTVLNLPGEVTMNRWDNDYIRITALISTNFDQNVAKKLTIIGRYNIVQDNHNKTIVLTMPNTESSVIIKGIELNEKIMFEVSAPKGYKVFVKNTKSKGYILNS